MIKENISVALNNQINAELYSSYLYYSMASYFESIDMPGAANWMKIQAQEEMSHAIKIYNFVIERDGRVIFKDIEAPPSEWDSPVNVFQAVYDHEMKVTGLINDLVSLAVSEKDYATNNFLNWFVDEQVEEEASAKEVLQKFKLGKDAPGALFMIDKELGLRVFTAPASE